MSVVKDGVCILCGSGVILDNPFYEGHIRDDLPPCFGEPMLNHEDLQIDVYRSGRSFTAVRIVHKPTGLSATCGLHNTQYQNKAEALADLDKKVRQHYKGSNDEV